jgi:hypothetical protein
MIAPISAAIFPIIKKYLLPIRSAREPAQTISKVLPFCETEYVDGRVIPKGAEKIATHTSQVVNSHE